MRRQEKRSTNFKMRLLKFPILKRRKGNENEQPEGPAGIIKHTHYGCPRRRKKAKKLF